MDSQDPVPVGYAGLVELYAISALPHYRKSFIAHCAYSSEKGNYEELHFYPKKYFSKDLKNPLHHLEFALKYDGVNLEILSAVFERLDPVTLENYIHSKPTSQFARKIWYLYEFLMDKRLNIKDAEGGSYTALLDPKNYYTGPVIRSKRHYLEDNLLGNRSFCPFVRKTELLLKYEQKSLPDVAKKWMNEFDLSVISRAIQYLYMKETMSSYEIERERPDSTRTMRFIEALKQADHIEHITKKSLVELQNIIVDPRFASRDYRDFQNYIGSEPRLDLRSSQLHYISPKPEDVPGFMQGLLDCIERNLKDNANPVIIAAAVAFGFVFIHPFEDGNGRIHRFLIHYIFAKKGFVPKGAIFPISAVILKDMGTYDRILETFSEPLLKLIKNYQFNDRGELSVIDKTDSYYRYFDYTRFAEYLFGCVEKTMYADFKNEIDYLIHYDKAKKALQEVVDMPDKLIYLFVQCVLQNKGHLSSKKRENLFPNLSDAEIREMESIVIENLKDFVH